MNRLILLGVASGALIAAPAAAPAAAVPGPETSQASTALNLRLTVGVYCSVRHQSTDIGAAPGGAVRLGTLVEYCNAPRGYELVINYTPGSLRNARVFAGEDQVVLDGSGQAILSRSNGPRIRQREVSAIPGKNGFDASRLDVQIIPS